MEGIQILNVTQIATPSIVIIVLMIMGWIGSVFSIFISGKLFPLFAFVFIATLCFVLLVCGIGETYATQYEATISDDIPISELRSEVRLVGKECLD